MNANLSDLTIITQLTCFKTLIPTGVIMPMQECFTIHGFC